MKTVGTSVISILLLFGILCSICAASSEVALEVVEEISLGDKVGTLRAVPIRLGKEEKALLVAYSADRDIDPWIEMFYAPTDRMKLALFSLDGRLIWKKELGRGTLNGIWFTPIFPFDLDGDGVDEIYFVNNTDPVHILSYDHLRLEVLEATTGKTLAQWPWRRIVHGTNSHTFRNFILGGQALKEPVLLTAQGTYGRMGLQAWGADMETRWERLIEEDEPGARGSHMSPVVDINHDEIDEILWGERCLRIDNGEYLFIADKNRYDGHSDVVQPTLRRETKEWNIFTCRESGDRGQIKPRVVMFDDRGNRLWTDLEEGHMDMGWTAHMNSAEVPILAFTISRGGKVAGPEGFFRTDVVEYAYNALSGERIELPFAAYNTIPVDLDGDGYHEFARAVGEQADRRIYDAKGNEIGYLGDHAYIAMASKFLDLPGEQIFCYYPDGTIKIWADRNAEDSEVARERYASPYYEAAQRLTAVGYNLTNLGGL